MTDEKPCECLNMASKNILMTALAGHHENCKHRKSDKEILTALIRDLVYGIDCWSTDEDGVHPDCWEAYKKALTFLGISAEAWPKEKE